MNKEIETYKDLVSWKGMPDFCGIAIFENLKTKERIALNVPEYFWNVYAVGRTVLPYSAQPNDSWSYAPLVCKTKDVNQAMKMLFRYGMGNPI